MVLTCAVCKGMVDMPSVKGRYLHPHICCGECFVQLIKQTPAMTLDRLVLYDYTKQRDLTKRSHYERKFAAWCVENKIAYEYEPYAFEIPRPKNTRKDGSGNNYIYIPDFILKPMNIIIEVKGGIWEGNSYQKLNEFSRYYPIYLITPEILKVLKKEKL